MEYNPDIQSTPEIQERGQSVTLRLKILRHGERVGTYLTNYGRQATRDKARESFEDLVNYDAIKAIGSPVDPNPEAVKNMGRALETAHIYADELADQDKFVTRENVLLSYETIISPAPYDHMAMYNDNLPKNFLTLSDSDKAEASKKAQTAVVSYLAELKTPEAIQYKKEIAGAYACLIDHYIRMLPKLKSGSKVLIPAGTHGGMMEFILLEAGVITNNDGNAKTGLTLSGIGGGFDPSEAFNIDITTDEEGQNKPLVVTFDNPNRPIKEVSLDMKKIKELKDFYLKLHPKAI